MKTRRRRSPAPERRAAAPDDFEWPPPDDDVSVHDVQAKPWRDARPATAEAIVVTPGPVARPRRRTPRRVAAVRPVARPDTRWLKGLVVALAIAAALVGWLLYQLASGRQADNTRDRRPLPVAEAPASMIAAPAPPLVMLAAAPAEPVQAVTWREPAAEPEPERRVAVDIVAAQIEVPPTDWDPAPLEVASIATSIDESPAAELPIIATLDAPAPPPVVAASPVR